MLLIHCPVCAEARPETEFRYGGEAHIARAAEMVKLTDAELADYLYLRTNPKGWHVERWQHAAGCGRFFNAVRNTVSDRLLATYRSGDPRPDIAALLREAGA